MSLPSTRTWPVVGRSRPPRICSNVVLPEPDEPTMAMRSPVPMEIATPCRTSRVTGPWRKLLWTLRASRTGTVMRVSLMSQGLRGRCAGSAPRGIDRREGAQDEGDAANLQHVSALYVGREIADEVDAGVDELG